jgi:hypothetical protein
MGNVGVTVPVELAKVPVRDVVVTGVAAAAN